ncbi:MAG: hypothetical protein AAAB35_12995 [Phyllobacterium sp.]|uniref:hypothetical protein n=1 Tax=Phyllobacterium sp. TaxID=1871046 RepID=UPI0030F102B6
MLVIRYLPERERIDLLRGLVQRFPELIGEYNLYVALTNPGDATLEFLLEIASGRYQGKSMDQGTPHDYPQKIFEQLAPQQRDHLPERFAREESSGAKVFLASILLASGDHDIFLMLAADPIGRSVIGQGGWTTQQNLLYIHHPVGENASYYNLIPRELQRLREDCSTSPNLVMQRQRPLPPTILIASTRRETKRAVSMLVPGIPT